MLCCIDTGKTPLIFEQLCVNWALRMLSLSFEYAESIPLLPFSLKRLFRSLIEIIYLGVVSPVFEELPACFHSYFLLIYIFTDYYLITVMVSILFVFQGYGPATQVRWLQDQKPVIAQPIANPAAAAARYPVGYYSQAKRHRLDGV